MKVEFKNLGPIRKATLDIRPLTVVIGPNNTGKTHLAKAFAFATQRFTQLVQADLASPTHVALPANAEPKFFGYWQLAWESAAKAIANGHGASCTALNPHNSNAALEEFWHRWRMRPPVSLTEGEVESSDDVFLRVAAKHRLLQLAGVGEVFYLPAERTAILEELQTFLAAALRFDGAVPGFGVVPDVAGRNRASIYWLDLLKRLVDSFELCRNGLTQSDTSLAAVGEALVAAIQGGDRVVWEEGAAVPFPVLRLASGQHLALERASSAIKQLGPLALWLQYSAKGGATVVIDEPELNLHPENQARLTEALAILVNLGVRVFVTTHSPYIVDHLNNLMAMHALKPAAKTKVTELLKLQDRRAIIDPESVAVYQTTTGGRVKDIVNRRNKIVDWGTFGEVSEYVTNLYADVLNAE